MTSLRGFIEGLSPEEVLRIQAPVDYVPTALVMELEKANRSPVIYIEPKDTNSFPIVANLFGDRRRMAKIAGVAWKDFYLSWGRFLANPIPPQIVQSGPAHETVATGKDASCAGLPVARHFASDAGPYISSGIFVCKDPNTGIRNLSFSRMLQKSPTRFTLNIGALSDLSAYHAAAAARGRNLEAAVVIGAPPAVYLAASARVAINVDEYDVAGSLLGKPLSLVKCKTIDVEVPADAEIVLEGEILANEFEDEGPAAEYTGYSSSRSSRNVFIVKAITRRQAPIFLDIITGAASEHIILAGIGRQARDFTRLKEMIPGLKDINFPRSGHSYHAYFSMKKMAEGEPRRALMHLFALDPFLKLAVAVDEDVDVSDEVEVMWALATRFQADKDMFMVPDVLCNRLDPSSQGGMGAKLGLDATVPPGWGEQRALVSAEATAAARALIRQHLDY